eukprot:g17578.t1
MSSEEREGELKWFTTGSCSCLVQTERRCSGPNRDNVYIQNIEILQKPPTDDITSAAAGYTTSGTAIAIDTTADATASISVANTTDTEDTPADTAAAAAYPAPPTADTDATPPTTDADVAPPTTSTSSSSRGDSSTQPCRVFTIPP